MSDGWVRVNVPSSAQPAAAFAWQVRIHELNGRPGEMMTASPGSCRVVLEGQFRLPHGHGAARLEVTVPVEAGRVTEVRLSMPEPLLRSVLTQPQPTPPSLRMQETRECEAAAPTPRPVPPHGDLRVPWLARWQRRAWITFVPRC